MNTYLRHILKNLSLTHIFLASKRSHFDSDFFHIFPLSTPRSTIVGQLLALDKGTKSDLLDPNFEILITAIRFEILK